MSPCLCLPVCVGVDLRTLPQTREPSCSTGAYRSTCEEQEERMWCALQQMQQIRKPQKQEHLI